MASIGRFDVGCDLRLPCLALIVLAIAACESRIALDADAQWDDEFSAEVEREIATSFDPESESKDPPRRGELLSAIDLTGEWSTTRGWDSTTMTFSADESGGYVVQFETSGCVASWHLERRATYSGHTITLDRPVKEYLPATYTRLYTVRYRDNTYLVPSARVSDFDGELGERERSFDWLLLSRTP